MRHVGIDIGATAVRVAEVSGLEDGSARVTRLAVRPLPHGAVTHGVIRHPEAVAVALDAALRQAKTTRNGVVLGLAAPDVVVTSRAMHGDLSTTEREAVLRNAPTPISPRLRNDDLAISTYRIGDAPTDGGPLRDDIAVAAALDTTVDLLTTVCTLARCEPRAVDLAGAALLRALVRIPPEDDDVQAIVDIGASKTTVAVRRGPHLCWVRTLEGGGTDVTRAVMDATGDTWEDAELRKRRLVTAAAAHPVLDVTTTGYGAPEQAYRPGPERTTTVEDAFTEAVETIVDQVALSIDSARSVATPTSIILTGGSAQLRGLPVRLFQRIGIPTSLGRPWVHLAENRANARYLAAPDQVPALVHSLAVAVGLALWKEVS